MNRSLCWFLAVLSALALGTVALWHPARVPVALPAVRAIEPKNPRIPVPGRDAPDAGLQPSTPKVPDRLTAITGGELPIAKRLEAINQTKPVDDRETQALLSFVEKGSIPQGLTAGAYHNLVNDIWNALHASGALPAHLQKVAATSKDAVIRDYALQHLARISSKDHAAQVRAIEASTRDVSGTIAGTSLLGLRAIGAEVPEGPAREAVERTARERSVAVLSDPSTHLASRVTALALCAEMGERSALPAAIRFFSDPACDPQLRVVAARAIGALGGASELPLLRQARATGGFPLLFSAADAAARQLSATSGTQPALKP
jgi:hypothetical protein